MKVKELIRRLKEFPPESRVGIQAHDDGETELQGFAFSVREFDPETSFDPEYCKGCRVVISCG